MRSARVAFTAITASVGLFAVLETAAMRAYPGGTWWEPTRAGASFWENYLCDFVRASAIDGAPNAAGSRLAAGAMVALTLGLVPVWLAVPRLWGAPDAPPRPAGDGSGSPVKRPGPSAFSASSPSSGSSPSSSCRAIDTRRCTASPSSSPAYRG